MNTFYRLVAVITILLRTLGCYAQSNITLEEMFHRADSINSSIALFEQNHLAALQAVKVSKNKRLPSVEMSVSASLIGNGWTSARDFSNSANVPMPHFGNNLAIEASQVIYAGGAIEQDIQWNQLHANLTAEELEQERQNIRFRLCGYYFEIIKLDNQRSIYNKNIVQTKRLLADMQAKQKAGIVLSNDIVRYELQLQTLELRDMQLKNQRDVINHQLNLLIGFESNKVLHPDTTLFTQIPLIGKQEEWLSQAEEMSPQMHQATIAIAMAKKRERLVLAERLPHFSLFAANKLDGPILIEVPTIDRNFNYWYVGIGLHYDIASLYKGKSKSTLAKLETQSSHFRRETVNEQLQNAIHQDYTLLQEAFERYHMMEKNLELASTNYQTINSLYLNELATITEMLDASNAKLSAELELNNAEVEIFYHYYKLKHTTGTL